MQWVSDCISPRARVLAFERTAADESAIARLEVPDMARLRYVFDAIREIKRALAGRVPLIGFAGSPFTLACYMIEGAGSSDFATVRRMAHGRPDLLQRLVAMNARAVSAYLDEQIRAGVDAVMLFDTWGGLLTTEALPGALARPDAIGAARRCMPAADGGSVPAIVFTKGGGQWLDALATCGAQCVGLDWTVDLAAARRRVGERVALQGNLDPIVLLADAATVAREATAVVRAAGTLPGPHLQSWPRHRARDPSGERRRAGRNGAPRVPCIARRVLIAHRALTSACRIFSWWLTTGETAVPWHALMHT